MTIVVDTSAILAVIIGEPKKDKIKLLTKDRKIIGPSSIPWEMGNAFSAMLKRGRISLEDAQQGYDIFQMIPIQYVDIDFKQVLKLSYDNNMYAYDAYFLDCCLRHNGHLLSLDQKLLKIADKIKIKILEV